MFVISFFEFYYLDAFWGVGGCCCFCWLCLENIFVFNTCCVLLLCFWLFAFFLCLVVVVLGFSWLGVFVYCMLLYVRFVLFWLACDCFVIVVLLVWSLLFAVVC